MNKEQELPVGCKMRAHSRYASDDDCASCHRGECEVCPEYKAMAEASMAAKRAEHAARRSSDEQAEVVGAALDRGEVLPKLANCGHYLAEDNTGQWHYINHANTWQTYPGPTTPEARAGVTEAMVEMAMSAYWGTSPGGRRTARDRMVDALLAALAVGDEGIREVLRDALRFISNIDNAHPVVRKLRAALKDAP